MALSPHSPTPWPRNGGLRRRAAIGIAALALVTGACGGTASSPSAALSSAAPSAAPPSAAASAAASVAASTGPSVAASQSGSATLLPNKGKITILTWEGYQDPAWLTAYKAKTGVEVTQITAGSVDEMFAKAQANSGQIDLVNFDAGSLQRYKDAGLLEPVDPSLVPNVKNIAPGLPWQQAFTLDGTVYGVPYNWGTQPLMWTKAAFPTAPTSWKVLWDAQYKGKVTIPDDSYIGFPMVGLSQGITNPYQLDDAGFATIKQALTDLRPNIKTLTTGFNDAENLYAAGDVVVGYCQNVAVVNDLNKKGNKFAYGYPTEGTPFWIDGSEILKGGNRQEVYDFINATLDAQHQGDFITASGNAGILSYDVATSLVAADVLAATEVKNLSNPDFWKAMSPMVTPNKMDQRISIWNEFKAGI
jgi:spermidine/putrescine transport system substrate-binding protein